MLRPALCPLGRQVNNEAALPYNREGTDDHTGRADRPMFDDTLKAVFLSGFVVGSVIRGLYTWRNRPSQRPDDRKAALDKLLLMLASVGLVVAPLLYVLTPWLDFADYHLPIWAGWTGAAVFAAALWLLWRSHADLGRNWSPSLQIREGHLLVTGGVYRHIRHPMYAAHGLWAIAQALLLQNWIAGPALLAVFLPLYLVRAPREERMMLGHFGEDYRLYMSRTGRLIPKFWW